MPLVPMIKRLLCP